MKKKTFKRIYIYIYVYLHTHIITIKINKYIYIYIYSAYMCEQIKTFYGYSSLADAFIKTNYVMHVNDLLPESR